MFLRAAEKAGRPVDTVDTLKGRIEAAGFVNIHEKVYEVPIGEWTSNPIGRRQGDSTRLTCWRESRAMQCECRASKISKLPIC